MPSPSIGGFPSRPNFATAKIGGESLRAVLAAVKNADTVRSSTIVLANDPDLTLALATPGRYLVYVEMPLLLGVGVSGGFQACLAYSGSSGQIVGNTQIWSTSALAGFGNFDTLGAAATILGGGTTYNASTEKHYARMVCTLLTASAGNLTLQWAQSTSTAVTATLRANASLTATRLA
jgi:hypothetical protein